MDETSWTCCWFSLFTRRSSFSFIWMIVYGWETCNFEPKVHDGFKTVTSPFLRVRIQWNNYIKSARSVYPISPHCNWYVAVVLRDHPQPSWVLLPVQTTQQGCGLSLVHPLSSGLALSSTLVLVSVSSQALLFLFFLDRLLSLFVWTCSLQASNQTNQPVFAKHWTFFTGLIRLSCTIALHLVAFQARISIQIKLVWMLVFFVHQTIKFSSSKFQQIQIRVDSNF